MKTFVALLLALVSLPSFAAETRWARIVCEAVPQNEAVSFATANHFLGSWDYLHETRPPYVAPKGTLACTVPARVTSDTDSSGHLFYTLDITLLDQPFHLAPCVVAYFDGTRGRRFSAFGSGMGYVDLVPGVNSMDATFSDLDHFDVTEHNDFSVASIGRDPAVTWASETRGDGTPMPVVSRCHVEL
jgi:hypothetical protein